jgi:hypothetical protein
LLDSNTCFTKDNERQTEDGHENSGFERAKSLSIAIRLKEAASPCEAGFVMSRHFILEFLLDTAFARTAQRLPVSMMLASMNFQQSDSSYQPDLNALKFVFL